MDITKTTLKDRTAYSAHYPYGMDQVDSDYNTYPEEWIRPDNVKWDHSLCACGCECHIFGGGTYRPGHDMKHYGQLLHRYRTGDLAEKLSVLNEAKSMATSGVEYKLFNKFGVRMLRVADSDDSYSAPARYVFVYASTQLVTKVGRWYYPVIQGLDGILYRSGTTVQDRFDAGHHFFIPVSIDDVVTLRDVSTVDESTGAWLAA